MADGRFMIQIDVEVHLEDQLARRLIDAAQVRKTEPVEVLADIIEAILGDNLIDAVLDDVQPATKAAREPAHQLGNRASQTKPAASRRNAELDAALEEFQARGGTVQKLPAGRAKGAMSWEKERDMGLVGSMI